MPPVPHATPLQRVVYGEETALGTAVTPTAEFSGIEMAYWGPQGSNKPITPSGLLIPTGTMHTKETSGSPMSGMPGFSDLRPVLNSAFIKASVSAGVSTHEPLANTANTVSSYTIVAGDSAAAYQYPGAYVNDLDLTFTRDDVTIGGAWVGQREDPSGTIPGSISPPALVPVQPATVAIKSASSYAGTYSAYTGGFRLGFKFSNLRNQVWTLDTSQPSYSATVPARLDNATIDFSYVADTTAGDYVAPTTLLKWRAGTTVYLQVVATQDGTHALSWTFAAQVLTFAKSDEGGILSITATLCFINDATANKWMTAVLTAP